MSTQQQTGTTQQQTGTTREQLVYNRSYYGTSLCMSISSVSCCAFLGWLAGSQMNKGGGHGYAIACAVTLGLLACSCCVVSHRPPTKYGPSRQYGPTS